MAGRAPLLGPALMPVCQREIESRPIFRRERWPHVRPDIV